MKSKNSKSAFAILEVVVALALTLLVASVVFFYGRIIIENAKISKLKSDIDLTVSSVKNGFYSLYEKYPGMLSEEEIRSSFSDDKGTLSCSGAGTSDLSCYSSSYFDRTSLHTVTTGGSNCYATSFTPTVMNAVNELVLSGNVPKGLIDLQRSYKEQDTGATCASAVSFSSIWSTDLVDKYEIPFNSSFKGYWFPFTGPTLSFGYSFTLGTFASASEKTRRNDLASNYFISIRGKNISGYGSTNYTDSRYNTSPIVTKNQAYKFSQKFNNGVVIGYADSDYHLAKPGYRIYDGTGMIPAISSIDACHKTESTYEAFNDTKTDGALLSISINTSTYANDIRYGCVVVAKVDKV